jgi:cyclic beta-1,2-glucan glucanotransferase
LRGERLLVDPCVPRWWRGFEITYRRGRTIYRIKVENPLAIHRGIASVELDGALQTSDDIPLIDDGQAHAVRVVLGEKSVSEPEESRSETDQKERAGSSQ